MNTHQTLRLPAMPEERYVPRPIHKEWLLRVQARHLDGRVPANETLTRLLDLPCRLAFRQYGNGEIDVRVVRGGDAIVDVEMNAGALAVDFAKGVQAIKDLLLEVGIVAGVDPRKIGA